MNKFLTDTFGITSSELQTTSSTRIRSIIAEKYGRSVEVLDYATRVISISDIDKENDTNL